MSSHSCIDLSTLSFQSSPFPHCYGKDVLVKGIEYIAFQWLSDTSQWSFTKADFYEQHEFSLLGIDLPDGLATLISSETIASIQQKLTQVFKLTLLELVGVTAHKLVDGQRIAIHNDYIEGEETHRLVIHFNPQWTDLHGGYFMLFHSPKVEDVAKVIRPLHNSAIAFEISRKSHHAVSQIHGLDRYSIVYTFKGS